MTAPTTSLALPDVLERRAADDPDGVAFNVNGGAELRFAEWEARSRAVAHALLRAGVGTGARVALLFSGLDWIEYAVAYLGVLRTGATCVHLNDGLPQAETDRRLAQCEVARVVHADRLSPPVGFTGAAHPLSSLEGGDDGPVPVSVHSETIADILYTTGTTGTPKAYTVPHGNLTFGRDPELFRTFRGQPVSYMLVPMLLGTGTSATCVNAALSAPATSLVCDPDDVERMGELIALFRVGSIAITPWIATRMLAARIDERHDLSSVTMSFSGSAALPPALAKGMMALIPGSRVASACSQSEAGPALIVNLFDPSKPLAVGRPSATTELRLVDEHGETVPTGEVGEIWLRHPAPKKLYLDPELSRPILADGWYRTGDYARLDDEGTVFFFDRGADLVRTPTGPVSTIEIEAVLYDHPAVREAAVFGVDGQVFAACALLDPDRLDELAAYAETHLATPQVPTRYLVVETLPRSQNGKILKRELRRRVRDEALPSPA